MKAVRKKKTPPPESLSALDLARYELVRAKIENVRLSILNLEYQSNEERRRVLERTAAIRTDIGSKTRELDLLHQELESIQAEIASTYAVDLGTFSYDDKTGLIYRG